MTQISRVNKLFVDLERDKKYIQTTKKKKEIMYNA